MIPALDREEKAYLQENLIIFMKIQTRTGRNLRIHCMVPTIISQQLKSRKKTTISENEYTTMA